MEVLKSELNSTSAYVPADLTKDKLLQRHIDSLTKSNIKIDKIDLPTFYWLPKLHKNPYKSRFISNSSHCSTTILSKHITSALTAVKDHAIKYSETAFSNSNVNYFWSIKNSSEVIEKLRLKYLLSIFLHYTHHCRMILSKKKCCLLLNGLSTESQKRTSVLQIRRDFSPTRHMTRINVGLALSLVKLLLSSWKIFMCNLVTWYICIPTNSGDSYGHKLCSAYSRLIFILLREGFYVKPPEIQTVWSHRQV